MTAAGMSEALWGELSTITPATPWYPLRLPEGCALPAGVYQRISTVRPSTHSGGLDLSQRRYQLTVYSETYASGLAVARTVVAALNGTRSDWDGWSVVAMVAEEAEDLDPEPRGLFRQRVDVFLRSTAP